MSDVTKTQSAREVAGVEFRRQRARHEEWTTKRAALEVELEALQARAGDAVLEQPDVADGLTREMQSLRDQIDIAARAAAAAAPKVEAARVAALEAEAVEYDDEAAAAQVEVDRFEAKTKRLRAALEAHDGRPWSPEQAGADGFVTAAPSAVGPLTDRVGRAETTAEILRTLAAGGNAGEVVGRLQQESLSDQVFGVAALDLYPRSLWAEDALVEVPAIERAKSDPRAALEAHDRRVREEQALVDRVATLPHDRRETDADHRERSAGVGVAKRFLNEAGDERARLVQAVENMDQYVAASS